MKELSIEEKAKAYDSMFERLKKMYENNKTNVADRLIYERYFPELKESEDEKVRKQLLEMVHDTTGDSLWVDYNIHKEDAIAWLEKQGEQKPAWSEEDEAIYYGVIETEQYMLDVVNGIKKFAVGNISIKEECTRELNWFKSLKERYTWKPSDEQMKGIECTIKTLKYQLNCGDNRLDSLYNDLKKLKG